MVQAAELRRDVIDRALHRGRVQHVGRGGGHRYLVGRQPGRRVGQASFVPGDQADRCPLGGQRLGDREADAPAAPGDQRTLATQA